MRKLSFEEIVKTRPGLDEIERQGRFPIFVLAENIRSLYNVGAIFRTSDAARIKKLFLCGFTGTPPRNEISKTALGAEHSVPWEYQKSAVEVIQQLKSQKIHIVALEHTDCSSLYYETQFTFPLCLVIGNEVEGISDAIVTMADQAVQIPMYGIKQSLNVAVAYGIAVYEILRQYLQQHKPNK
ncbi:TrmH family RNA methyltransferase [candidate division KSB1 bacterium]|nr:MAG: TrmH family RNA methyltransferase [candidate division KSB1 bacterium]